MNSGDQVSKLSQLLVQELSTSNTWFATFKILHESEGIHAPRSRRLIPSGVAAHDIDVGGARVGEFCSESLVRVNRIVESCYGLMT
jgi:hypothetical protein